MRRRGSILQLCLLLVLQGSTSDLLAAQEVEEAPFGLTWGTTVDEIKSLGVDVKPAEDKASFDDTYLASKLPKSISGQEVTILSFGHNNKLWRIAAVSTAYENDPYGNAAKDRYEELSTALAEKYGKGEISQRLGTGFFAEPKNFVYGLSRGESVWFTNFQNSNIFVQLGLYAPDSLTLRWRLIYEHKGLRAEFEQDKKAHEKGSL